MGQQQQQHLQNSFHVTHKLTGWHDLLHAALHSNQPTFDLDPAALEKRYKLLQWQLHPDKTVTRSPEEQHFSAEQATRVNQAYGVLRHPLSRANYMVGLQPRGAALSSLHGWRAP